MREQLRERLTGWGTRLSFAVTLLVVSELVVWQRPTTFNGLEWLGIALIYVALAAMMLDLLARWRVNTILSLFLAAGLYGVVDTTLISHITSEARAVAIAVRPLAAQPLAFMAALAAFQILASGRATGPRDFGAALIAGLLCGIWARWFPEASDEPVPLVSAGTMMVALLVGLLACLVIRYALPPADIYERKDWLLTPFEWAFVVLILWGALMVGYLQDLITPTGIGIAGGLGGFFAIVLIASRNLRHEASYLATVTPPVRPNPAAWVMIVIPFLLLAYAGYSLPGSGDSSTQSDVLFGALTGFGLVWPPAISALIGAQAFAQLAREGF